MQQRRLDTIDASAFILAQTGRKVSPKTLQKLRVVGGGPGFQKFGQIPDYGPDDLLSWVADRTTRTVKSTSELGPKKRGRGRPRKSSSAIAGATA